ncbi:MAG TPA: 50S ribosomal protein L11 methyltransferase [Gammaproteobacteria bacterium]|jgi:ribosomal protein L11 methyltransferase|nr:50S ribosomal protein L11 methyltransferase [Gammaproteobacteria bacterium]MDP6731846.1 50S ribosomal protein L11 methyltransferase [Gammaproteobacteria bacterium]HAJ75039.1 50S ribosomal protein L11 methyltransferase [Gammaproteobacteria bacterium]|tara:strand:- start:4039 stop:4920 length:882 start_codon:yes stop_codon:yes gene_type:complete
MWQQLKIQLESEDCASLEQLLLEHGALSISYLDAEDQPIFQKEPGSTPLWENTCLLSLFDENTDLKALLNNLRHNCLVKNPDELSIEILEDQKWERSWMADFHPMQFGQRLWICPSWLTPPDPNAINIILDPGLAFGSGTHTTTSLCLRWLEQAPLQGAVVVDYGCGSGILAIAAALLGASKVHAVDNDLQAIAATIDNGYRNNIAEGVITAYLPDALPSLQADILVANILAEPLLDLSAKFSELIKPGGMIVLSGVLEEQLASLVACYSRWFHLDNPVVEQQWSLLSGTHKA